MLHPVNLDLLGALARHHPDGRPKDRMEEHRRTILLQRRSTRREAWLAMGLRILDLFRQTGAERPSTNSVAPPALRLQGCAEPGP